MPAKAITFSTRSKTTTNAPGQISISLECVRQASDFAGDVRRDRQDSEGAGVLGDRKARVTMEPSNPRVRVQQRRNVRFITS